MRAAVFLGARRVEVADRPDPQVAAPTDAVVRVALGCVCGSDLWYYRGESPHALGPIGHEFVGVVEQVGAEVRSVAEGDVIVAPFKFSDGTCAHCRAGWTSNCVAGAPFGTDGIDGGAR
jgi:threonine dehydrogenase-like Zn-dependent dehydrogenase